MRAPGVRARSLLLVAATVFAFRPADAAQSSGWVLQVRLAEGGSHYSTASGTAAVSVSATDGATNETSSASPTQGGVHMVRDYWACISVDTPGKWDYGCANVPMTTVMIDPAMNMAVLTFSVPSAGHPGKKLTANVTIRAQGMPMTQFNVWDVELQPPPPSTRSIRYSGPMLGMARNGIVTGNIRSEYVGGDGKLVQYGGPPTSDHIAFLSQGIVHTAYAGAE